MGSGGCQGRGAGVAGGAPAFWNYFGETRWRASADDAAVQVWCWRENWFRPAMGIVDRAAGRGERDTRGAAKPGYQWRTQCGESTAGAQRGFHTSIGTRDAPTGDCSRSGLRAGACARGNGGDAASEPAGDAFAPGTTRVPVLAARFELGPGQHSRRAIAGAKQI